ncbi:MAG: hypothetical protein KTR31_09745 [Myxococcales bacterium]|nr:hypothetical protein [Myxococcales bacterium]
MHRSTNPPSRSASVGAIALTLWLAASLAACGTGSDDKSKDVTLDTGGFTDTTDDDGAGILPVTADCPEQGECIGSASFRVTDLWDCFGYDPSQPGGFPAGTPNEIVDGCETSTQLGVCIVTTVPVQSVLVANTCPCVWPDDCSFDDCCVYDETQVLLPQPWFSQALACGLVDSTAVDCSPSGSFECGVNVCIPPVFAASSKQPRLMSINASASTVRLSGPTGTTTFKVQGSLAAEGSSNTLAHIAIEASDGAIAGVSVKGWKWWLESPARMQLQPDGGFGLLASANVEVLGFGEVAGQPAHARAKMGANAAGSFDPKNHTWTLDFSQTTDGWTVRFHLEGSYVDP